MSDFDYLLVKIIYRLQGIMEPFSVNIAPEEYFDLKYLGADETLEVESVAKYWNTLEYLDNTIRRKIHVTRLEIYDQRSDFLYTVEDTFWNDQRNFLRERIDYLKGKKNYHLIILSLQKNGEQITYEFLRLEDQEGQFKPIEHTIIQNKDGIEETLESYTRGMDGHGKFLKSFLS